MCIVMCMRGMLDLISPIFTNFPTPIHTGLAKCCVWFLCIYLNMLTLSLGNRSVVVWHSHTSAKCSIAHPQNCTKCPCNSTKTTIYVYMQDERIIETRNLYKVGCIIIAIFSSLSTQSPGIISNGKDMEADPNNNYMQAHQCKTGCVYHCAQRRCSGCTPHMYL